MKLDLKQTIAAMMTENTGTNMLDSGGAYGRNWQRNAGMTCNDFDAMPAAILEIDLRKWQDKPHADMMLSVNIYHKLTSGILELDDLCRDFNAMPVDDWESDLNGVSDSGENWLSDRGLFGTRAIAVLILTIGKIILAKCCKAILWRVMVNMGKIVMFSCKFTEALTCAAGILMQNYSSCVTMQKHMTYCAMIAGFQLKLMTGI